MEIKKQIVEYFIQEAENLCNCTSTKISFVKWYNTLHDYDKAIERIIDLTSVEDDSISYSAVLGEAITRIIIENVSVELNKPREDLRNVIRFHSLEIVQDLVWFIIEVDSSKLEDGNISSVIKFDELKSDDKLTRIFESFKQQVSNAVAYSVAS